MAIHDLTFTDWDNYTDGDGTAFTLDWTDVAAMTRQFPYPYIEAIRQAVNERFAISDRGDQSNGTAIPPIITLVMGNGWVNNVLKLAIHYVRGKGSFAIDTDSRYWSTERENWFNWIRPGAISTTKNLTEGYEEILLNYLYTGTWMLYDSSATQQPQPLARWTTVQTNMLDDAGISDSTFRTWWLQAGTEYIAEIQDNMLFSWVDIVLNLKKMLGLMTMCLDSRGFLRTTAGDGYYKSFSAGYGQTEAGWNLTKTDFDAASWNLVIGSYSTPRLLSVPYLYAGYGFSIDRIRTELTFDLGGTCNRNVEVSAGVAYDTHFSNPRPPYYQPYDFDLNRTLVSSVYGSGPPLFVYGVEKTATPHGSGSFTMVSGDYAPCSLLWEVGSRGRCGWTIGRYLLFENFDVVDGFTFR